MEAWGRAAPPEIGEIMMNLARAPFGGVVHLVDDGTGATYCGRSTADMAVWPIALTPRTTPAKTCARCVAKANAR